MATHPTAEDEAVCLDTRVKAFQSFSLESPDHRRLGSDTDIMPYVHLEGETLSA